MSKKLFSCYIKESTQKRICSAGDGGFSAGIEYCAKYFAKYAKGSDNYNAALNLIKCHFSESEIVNFSDIYSDWFNNGYHLPNLLCCLSQLFDSSVLTINSEMEIKRTGEPWAE